MHQVRQRIYLEKQEYVASMMSGELLASAVLVYRPGWAEHGVRRTQSGLRPYFHFWQQDRRLYLQHDGRIPKT